jgi:plastocyanin
MRSRRLLAVGLALALSGALLPARPGEAQTTGRTWQIYAGGESADHHIQVNTYRPGRFTVGVGDQVTWLLDSLEPHTVTFLSGGERPPQALRVGDISFRNPLATMPAGGGSYGGQGYVNSGFLYKGDTFSLTFTAPGTYEYVCLVHVDFGLRGRVVVEP